MSKCVLQTERKGNYMRDSHKELVIKTAIQEYKNSVLFGFSSSTAHAINMMENAYNNAKDIYTWTSSMTGYRASNIFPNDAVFAHKGSSLINDEVIIYREEQLTIQYLIELQI